MVKHMSTKSDPPSLYERVGGAAAIPGLVNQFYSAILKDASMRPYFVGVDMDKLKRMQVEFFSAALGGPVHYSGKPILDAHHDLRITLIAFQRFVQHLFDILEKYHLSEQECYDVIARLNLYVNDVVSPGTGLVD